MQTLFGSFWKWLITDRFICVLIEDEDVELPIPIVPCTLTPPETCDVARLVPVVEGRPVGLSDAAFSSSSSLGPQYLPQYSRLSSEPSHDSSK